MVLCSRGEKETANYFALFHESRTIHFLYCSFTAEGCVKLVLYVFMHISADIKSIYI